MSIRFVLVPYISIGDLAFGTSRDEIHSMLGAPLSSCKYGFPVADGTLDDHKYFYTLFSNKDTLEAVEIFPEYTNEDIVLVCDDVEITLHKSREALIDELGKLPDITQADDEEFSSERAGITAYIPTDDDDVISIIAYMPHYYDE